MGALFYAPFDTEHGSNVWTHGKGFQTDPNNEVVDADGWFVAKRSGLLQPSRTNVLNIERLGALVQNTEVNNVGADDYRDFTTASWDETDLTADNDSIAAADGSTRTTNTLTATGANGTLINDLGVIGSSPKVVSFWLKRKTGSGNIQLTMDNGAAWTTVTVGDNWERFVITQTVANPDVGIRIATSGDAVYVDFAQHHDNTSIQSGDITGGATRTADALSYAVTNDDIIKPSEGAYFVAVTPQFPTATGGYIFECRVGATDWVILFNQASTGWRAVIQSGSAQSANLPGTSDPVIGTTVILCVVWRRNDFRLYVNGALEASDTDGPAPELLDDEISLGHSHHGGTTAAHHRAHDLILGHAPDTGQVGLITQEIRRRTQNA